jgi:formate-dependent nitrite reductase cytochrome c552 subunit
MTLCSLKVEAVGSFEVQVTPYQTARCHNPGDHNLNAYFEIDHALTRGKLFYAGELMEVILSAADSRSPQVSHRAACWSCIELMRGRYLSNIQSMILKTHFCP